MIFNRLIILFLFISYTCSVSAEISSIVKNGAWYDIYNEKGKKVKSISVSSTGEMVGFSATFFIVKKGAWYELYDQNGKKYKSLGVSSIGDIISVTGNSFVARKGNWLNTYDAAGKKVKSNPSR